MITQDNRSIWPMSTDEFTGQAPTLADIAIGMSRTVRFAGQTLFLWTVLDHVLLVADIVGEPHRKHALMHDAHEAIIGDMPTTWKQRCPEFEDLAIELDAVIFAEHGVRVTEASREAVKRADFLALAAEAHALGHARADHYWPTDKMEEQFPMEWQWVYDHVRCGRRDEMLDSADDAVERFAQAWVRA